MSTPQFTTVALEGDMAGALAAIPAAAGVGQILGPEGRPLLIGRPANLRRWAASHLGAGRPARKGARPRTDLRRVATAARLCKTTSAFQQRLVFERLMGQHVPQDVRRDLRPPVFLCLDPSERFPRVTVLSMRERSSGLFGPFRDRRAARRAIQSLHKLFALRPCDFVFEPDPALPLGLGCVYAQVRTCAAPCLVRVTESAYRSLAEQAASFLARPNARSQGVAAWLPPWVSAWTDSRGIVVDSGGRGLEVYPVRGGAVLEEASVTASIAGLDAALAGLQWPAAAPARDDTPWLSAWLHTPRRTGKYLVVEEPTQAGAIAARVRASFALGEKMMLPGTQG